MNLFRLITVVIVLAAAPERAVAQDASDAGYFGVGAGLAPAIVLQLEPTPAPSAVVLVDHAPALTAIALVEPEPEPSPAVVAPMQPAPAPLPVVRVEAEPPIKLRASAAPSDRGANRARKPRSAASPRAKREPAARPGDGNAMNLVARILDQDRLYTHDTKTADAEFVEFPGF